jgi:hypothetical protein
MILQGHFRQPPLEANSAIACDKSNLPGMKAQGFFWVAIFARCGKVFCVNTSFRRELCIPAK